MSRRAHKMLTFVSLIMLGVLTVFTLAPKPASAAGAADHEIVVTLHAGEPGYFGDPSVKEKLSYQFAGDIFIENAIPETDDETLVFVGWSTDPNATEANVFSEETRAVDVGSDLYAVWTNECLLVYNASNGRIDIDGRQVASVAVAYQLNEPFHELQATSNQPDIYIFDGWYDEPYGVGAQYTSDTLVCEPENDVWAKWKFNPGGIEPMALDQEYPIDTTRQAARYSFTPEETTVYKVFLQNIDSVNGAYIQMMDIDTRVLAKSLNDYDLNAYITRELKAGVTYYFEFRDMGSAPGEFVAEVSKADCYQVTFHANRDEQQDAWFDDDPTKTEKVVNFSSGEEISDYEPNLILEDYTVLAFEFWSTDPNATVYDMRPVYVDGDLDLYAVYLELDTLVLDGNGGYFRLNNNSSQMVHSYIPGTAFETKYDPTIDNNLVKFAGWSRDPNATEPDPDIIEGVTLNDDLPEILYAVYTEKVTETFDANGGYMLDDPTKTVYYSTKGKGHIFYGMVVHNEDPRLRALGFVDQNGEIIPYTANIWPYYHVMEDTTYTTLWSYDLYLDANGGYWPEANNDLVGVWVPYEEPFTYQDVVDDIGEIVHPDPEMRFIGWATTPDAMEPDVPDGELSVRYLVENGHDELYAVWAKEEPVEPSDDDPVTPPDDEPVTPPDDDPVTPPADDDAPKPSGDDQGKPADGQGQGGQQGGGQGGNQGGQPGGQQGNNPGNNQGQPGGNQAKGTPATGDATNLALWAGLAGVAIVCVAAALLLRRRAQK